MKLLLCLGLLLAAAGLARAADDAAAIEQRVAEAVKSPGITVVHFWATWCPNCVGELAEGWRQFVEKNTAVNFVFIKAWDEKPGAPVLTKYGLGPQKNFLAFDHPNPSRRDGEKLERFLGFPMMWVPTTWVFRNGRQRYALNYGQVRFSILQQMIDDAPAGKWDK